MQTPNEIFVRRLRDTRTILVDLELTFSCARAGGMTACDDTSDAAATIGTAAITTTTTTAAAATATATITTSGFSPRCGYLPKTDTWLVANLLNVVRVR